MGHDHGIQSMRCTTTCAGEGRRDQAEVLNMTLRGFILLMVLASTPVAANALPFVVGHVTERTSDGFVLKTRFQQTFTVRITADTQVLCDKQRLAGTQVLVGDTVEVKGHIKDEILQAVTVKIKAEESECSRRLRRFFESPVPSLISFVLRIPDGPAARRRCRSPNRWPKYFFNSVQSPKGIANLQYSNTDEKGCCRNL